MPHFGFGSATKILSQYYNDSDLEDEYNDEKAELLDFLNMESFDCESDEDQEEELAQAAPEQPPMKAPIRVSVPVANIDGVCSVCLTEFDEDNEALVLACGHTFCSDCLVIYLQLESGDISTLRHEARSHLLPSLPIPVLTFLLAFQNCPRQTWCSLFTHAPCLWYQMSCLSMQTCFRVRRHQTLRYRRCPRAIRPIHFEHDFGRNGRFDPLPSQLWWLFTRRLCRLQQ